MNIEHRTSNIERRILMTLRFFYFKSSEPQNFKGQLRLSWSFFKIDRIPYSMLGVQCSMFDVHFFSFISQKNNLALMGINPAATF